MTTEHPITVLRRIVDNHQFEVIEWPGGESLDVDATTANLLVRVIDAAGDDTRKKILSMMAESRARFLGVVDTAWKCVC